MKISGTLPGLEEDSHPCFSPSGAQRCARVHLPVAPLCNVSCNYCNRDFDCVNESRPGIASRIISPEEGLSKVKESVSAYPSLSTVAVAGPGDALANPERTFKTLRLVNEGYPRLNICMSTNGLNIVDYIEEISECGVSHLSVTVNSLDEEVSSKIYSFIKLKGKVFSGKRAGKILVERQIEGIRKLISLGISVKINSVVIPGINDGHLPFLAQRMKREGVSVINFLPMVMVKGAKFENIKSPSKEFYNEFLKKIPSHIPLMKHCRMCRADAEGFLGGKTVDEDIPVMKKTGVFLSSDGKVAVAGTGEGLVDEHFGRVDGFFIYDVDEKGKFQLIEKRSVEKFCEGKNNCADRTKDIERIASILSDCKMVLCSGAGGFVTHLLEKNGIKVQIAYGSIEDVRAQS